MDADFLTECERLRDAVFAPEPNRIVYFTDVPADFAISEFVSAFATSSDPLLREYLKSQGRWSGAGSIIGFIAKDARPQMLGQALHELSHVAETDDAPEDNEPTPEDLAKHAEWRQEWKQQAEQEAEKKIDGTAVLPYWWPDHGLKFTRLALHCHWRSWQAGFQIGLPEVNVAGWLYDLSPAWRYKGALGNEPERMRDATFAEILATEEPAEFVQLFKRDFAVYQAGYGERKAKADRVAAIHAAYAKDVQQEQAVG